MPDTAGVLALAGLRVRTIAALHGDAFGGGAALALTADFREGLAALRERRAPRFEGS